MEIDEAEITEWKSEYLPRLQQSFIYRTLEFKCKDVDEEVLVLVQKIVKYSILRTKTIIRHMGEYTLHDDIHLFRVLYIMEKLLTKANISNLSTPELMLLIASAFLHDIGMAPDEKDILLFKKVWDSEVDFFDDNERKIYEKFERFYKSKPEQQKVFEHFYEHKKFSEISNIQSNLITEFIRVTHAERVRDILAKDWNETIIFRNTDLTVELANLCQSHNEDALKLLEFDMSYQCGDNNYVCLPLVGLILRLSDILDFDGKRTPPILYSHLYVRNPVSIKEWQKHRSVENWEINSEFISFSAKCAHPAIEASIHEFCDLIDKELSTCNNIVSRLNEYNRGKGRGVDIKIPFKISRDKIQTKKDIYNRPLYTYKDTKFTLSKRQVIDLLMGTKLYGNPEVALRELLQNSIDACQLRQAQEQKWNNPYFPEVTVRYSKDGDEDLLEIIDNGTGMDQYIVDNYYSKVGSSFYTSADFFNLKAESNAQFTPRSRFGIGVLSCFMIADSLIVDTKKVYGPHQSSEAINITVEGQESIFWVKSGERDTPGTHTKLLLRKKENPWDRMSEDEFIKAVESVIPNPPIKINIETSKEKRVRDENSFSEMHAFELKDYSWKVDENIRYFEIELNDKSSGFVGSAVVAVLEHKGVPVSDVELFIKDLLIEEKVYTLEKKMTLLPNAIGQSSKTLSISDKGEITQDDSHSNFAKSKSKISLHGIEIPRTLFPEIWNKKNNQAVISWPFPLLLVLDINGSRDLDLNSSRTEIILSEKWFSFEEELAYQICLGIASFVNDRYWDELGDVFRSKSKNDLFLGALNKVKKERVDLI